MKKNRTIGIVVLTLIVLSIIIASLVLFVKLARQTLRYNGQVFSVEFSNDATTFTDPSSGESFLTSKTLNMGFGITSSSSQKDCGQSGSNVYQQIKISGNNYSLCAASNKETGKPVLWTVNFFANGKWYNATLIPNSADIVVTQKQAEKIFSSIQALN